MKKLILLFAILLTVTTVHAQKEKGYRGFFEIGHNFSSYATRYDSNNKFVISTTHGYQFRNLFFVGLGVSCGKYDYTRHLSNGNQQRDELIASFFGEFRYDLEYSIIIPRITPYADLKIGAHTSNIDIVQDGLYLSPQVGLRYAITPSCGINLGVSYQGLFGGIGGGFFQGIGLSLGIDF